MYRDKFCGLTMKYIDTWAPNNMIVMDAIFKTEENLDDHENILVSLSGGSDSDVMLDLIERVGYHGNVAYVFFDTGLEYAATKQHIQYLQDKYGIVIETHKALRPIPVSCREYGLPFLSKEISEKIERLQRHNFQWEDESFEVLWARYPRCKAALRWWCNEFGGVGRFNISRNKWLKEFMVANPPDFRISPKCCDGAEKNVSHALEAERHPDLVVTGVRKAEGGARGVAYKSCYTPATGQKTNQFRPLFYWINEDKAQYEASCGICHSECYTKYGLKRTGCACCPFGRDFEAELAVAKRYEPHLAIAATSIFGPSYEYTRRYRAFAAEMEANHGQR